MKTRCYLLLALLLSGCASMEKETEIPLTDVPGVVMTAAQSAVPGIEIDAAELEEEDGQRVYELSGEAGGKEYEIEISETGEVLEIEED
jgi:uncharacterized membrane protein YkoI